MKTASDKIEQTIVWQRALLSDLTKQAHRLDRSLSWCAQRAWKIARAEVSAMSAAKAQTAPDTSDASQRQKRTLFFPADMLAEIKAAAERQDRSVSWLVQRAWCLAVSEIEKTPAS
jgi:uncharacterized small protein (TIGR04563 family)